MCIRAGWNPSTRSSLRQITPSIPIANNAYKKSVTGVATMHYIVCHTWLGNFMGAHLLDFASDETLGAGLEQGVDGRLIYAMYLILNMLIR